MLLPKRSNLFSPHEPLSRRGSKAAFNIVAVSSKLNVRCSTALHIYQKLGKRSLHALNPSTARPLDHSAEGSVTAPTAAVVDAALRTQQDAAGC